MKRKLGVCTWTYGPRALSEVAASLARLGFDGVELHGDLGSFDAVETARLLADHGLSILSLTPADCDPAHPDAGTRKAAIGYYRELIDFAAAVRQETGSQPIVSFHGQVTRIKPVKSQEAEYGYLVESVRAVDAYAASTGVPMVYEVLNRYESHLINTGRQALKLLQDADARAMRILLDTYHMNIEEQDLPATIRAVGNALGLFHVADSNREAVGRGHTDFDAVLKALDDIGYSGSIIVECTASGPNPFTPVKDGDYVAELEMFLGESRTWLAAR
ncbi:sugar phosphate isomerase/epimerase [Acidisoma cellulosilytica]|uniref:Sugar phosphate isomerase/epimerase n=1 Tax=Acidisoma cellulosilyticum TaxID=2802395 RepID=A0A963Z128_9PROT|nr:sugar phosphate isomerase/epimerase family protein [Acidisoma cellulosilyticum]MCB8879905.1 sugar phosphate isomerase/epimerase [Acidisoma cellulosilyticum]